MFNTHNVATIDSKYILLLTWLKNRPVPDAYWASIGGVKITPIPAQLDPGLVPSLGLGNIGIYSLSLTFIKNYKMWKVEKISAIEKCCTWHKFYFFNEAWQMKSP